jgi:tetratricopeptide (TPR) repeat protein
MARKKPKRGGGKRRPAARPDLSDFDVPDQRAIEGMMWRDVLAQTSPQAPMALEQAQETAYQAFGAGDEHQRVRLARKALEISPDCADAYVLLAEHSTSRKEQEQLYRQGVAAGERALGPAFFQEYAGHFWGMLQTRGYMRSRMGLSLVLWTLGQREEAVSHLQDMLRLNPNDNQGVRYTLAGLLLGLDRDEDTARLLEQYPEDASATWAYTRALLAFRREGDTPEARRLLKAAQKANKHLVAFLVGDKHPPSELPDYYSMGDENEAIHYVAGFLPAWKATPGAVPWLRANQPGAKKQKAASTHPKGPLTFIKQWLLKHVPQEPTAWQADFAELPVWTQTARGEVRPWVVLVISRDQDLVLSHQITEDPPTGPALWDVLVQAMQNPLVGEPHRPTSLEVRADERWQSLQRHLAELGVELVTLEELDPLQRGLAELTDHMAGEQPPGLLDIPGVTPEQVGTFYEAAAEFYRQAPWRHVGYESAIQITCDRFSGGPWYAVVMGQSGLTMGLTLYEDLRLLKRLWRGNLSDEENARRTVATTVTFGEAAELSIADLEAGRRYGWMVARDDAYPMPYRKERGMTMRPPLAWELELLEGSLRAVPGFVARHRQNDPTRETTTVRAGTEELTMTLAWVTDED